MVQRERAHYFTTTAPPCPTAPSDLFWVCWSPAHTCSRKPEVCIPVHLSVQ